MQLIGLTGGIASGKSAVARRLAEHGAIVIDADQLAREVVAPGTRALARIAEEFGPTVIASDGSLDRAALGSLIFSSPTRRELLNSITHPAVSARSQELFRAAADADASSIVVYDVPLLVEAGRVDEFDQIVVVHASTETRIARMVELRGMERAEALRRISAQASDAERLAVADVVIDADVSLAFTEEQADALWDRLRHPGTDAALPTH